MELTNEEVALSLRTVLQSTGWQQIMVPTAASEIAKNIQMLIKGSNEEKLSDERLKGRVEGLQWWLAVFEKEVRRIEATLKQKAEEAKASAVEENQEFRGPYTAEPLEAS